MAQEFHKRVGTVSTKKQVVLMEPTSEEWVLGMVVVLKVAFTTKHASFIAGDAVLMEQGCADRFIAKDFARLESKEERDAAVAAGYQRDLYDGKKAGKKADAKAKSAKAMKAMEKAGAESEEG